MRPMSPQGGPKRTNTLVIVLAVLGGLVVVGLGTCVAGGLFLSRAVSNLADGGPLTLTPSAAVVSDLAGPKKDYVGSWTSAKGSTFEVHPDGTLALQKREGTGQTSLRGPIAAFRGNDLEMQLFVTVTIHVTSPPTFVKDHWEITVDSIHFERK